MPIAQKRGPDAFGSDRILTDVDYAIRQATLGTRRHTMKMTYEDCAQRCLDALARIREAVEHHAAVCLGEVMQIGIDVAIDAMEPIFEPDEE